ncbi:MAG TPA: tetratricopeptide repeat protein [Gemmatimonadales bacterium]|nr:tetratricopeptide repeat protein [Gemmatimonadales bacterium]
MRHLKCSSCGAQFHAGDMFTVDGATVCEPCGDRLLAEAQARQHEPQVTRIFDATICSRCNTDNGETDFRLIGGLPFCPRCGEALYAYPFPVWLKASFAALLLLLAFALWRNGPYFAAARHLVAGRRAMDRQDYQSAVTHFAELLPITPSDQDVILVSAKAYLMTGDVAGAQQFLQLRERYDSDPLFKEVDAIWRRATRALAKADSAGKLAGTNHTAAAYRLISEAAKEYPEARELQVVMLIVRGGDAFERKDYDLFLSANREALALMPEHPRVIAGVASALACKYAVTGSPAYRAEAESLLAVAERAAARSAQDKQDYDEYAERVRHRLATRIIIDQAEYNRRFRVTRAAAPRK